MVRIYFSPPPAKVFITCFATGPVVKLIAMHGDSASDQYHAGSGCDDLKCPVLWDIIESVLQLQYFTPGWNLQALALPSHTLNRTATRVRQCDVHRSIATGNQTFIAALHLLPSCWAVNKRNRLRPSDYSPSCGICSKTSGVSCRRTRSRESCTQNDN